MLAAVRAIRQPPYTAAAVTSPLHVGSSTSSWPSPPEPDVLGVPGRSPGLGSPSTTAEASAAYSVAYLRWPQATNVAMVPARTSPWPPHRRGEPLSEHSHVTGLAVSALSCCRFGAPGAAITSSAPLHTTATPSLGYTQGARQPATHATAVTQTPYRRHLAVRVHELPGRQCSYSGT